LISKALGVLTTHVRMGGLGLPSWLFRFRVK
jgi:hypothetical protein